MVKTCDRDKSRDRERWARAVDGWVKWMLEHLDNTVAHKNIGAVVPARNVISPRCLLPSLLPSTTHAHMCLPITRSLSCSCKLYLPPAFRAVVARLGNPVRAEMQ